MVSEKSLEDRLFNVMNVVALSVIAVVCLLPLVHVVAVSLSSRAPASGGFVSFWPVNFTLANYNSVLSSEAFYRSLAISVQRVVVGTAINMVLTVLAAYPLSKTPQEFRGRNIFMWMFIFAMLFTGGLIPTFLVVRSLGLLNSTWSLILPTALPIFNVILLMNFFREIPRELEEAAIMDGASYADVLFQIYLPLSLPALATLTLFCAVGHWNSWFDGLIYMTDAGNYPLQTFLRTVVVQLDLKQLTIDPNDLTMLSDRAVRGAQIMVSIVPILIVYPLLQRYFIAGIRLGAVKG